LISKAGTSTGYVVPEVYSLTKGMLEPRWERRPSARAVLRRLEEVILNIPEERLNGVPYPSPLMPAALG